MPTIKKKIKDLTQEECEKICKEYSSCVYCPLLETIKCVEYREESLEVEIEVKEND